MKSGSEVGLRAAAGVVSEDKMKKKIATLPWDHEKGTWVVDSVGSTVATIYSGASGYQSDNTAYIVRACNAYPELLQLLRDAQEELRLIRMKDCDAVYDSTLRSRLCVALAAAEGK